MAEIDQRAGDLLEVERVVACAHQLVEFGQPMQHQLFEFRHVGIGDLVALVVGERAEHPADGVAQLAIGVDIGLDDRLAEALVFRIVRGHDPEAQDIGAGILHDVLRRDDVAQRLRHLLALLVHGEAMGDDGVS